MTPPEPHRPKPVQHNGFVAPHDLEAEAKVLSECLLGPVGRMVAREVVRADDFYLPDHAHIFEAVCALDNAGESVDAVTVLDQLRRLGTVGGVTGGGLVALQADGLASENFARSHAKIVAELANKRRLLAGAVEGHLAALDPTKTAAEVAEVFDATLVAAQERLTEDDSLSGAEGIRFVIDRAQAAASGGTGLVGLPTGFGALDQTLRRLTPARWWSSVRTPGPVGQDGLRRGVATHNLLRGTPVLYARRR